MSEYRIERIEKLIHQKISELIVTRKIKDPRVSELLCVNKVFVSKDLAHAKVYVSGYLNPSAIEEGVAGLNSAHGFIQVHVGKALQTRNTPVLQFIVDHSIEEGFEINRKIRDISEE